MSSRQHTALPDSTGSSLLAQVPPPLSSASSVLAAVIPLPHDPLICYAVYHPSDNANPTQSLVHIEHARKQVLILNASRSIQDSILPSVYINPQFPALYLFSFTSQTSITESNLDMHFEGLILHQSSSFSPLGIYPCSLACSTQITPCPTCLNSNYPSATIPSQITSALFMPRYPLRRIFAQFLIAVQDRFINEMTEVSKQFSINGSSSPAIRFKGGVILGIEPTSSEWTSGWEHYSRQHPLVYCQLQVELLPSSPTPKLVVHPLLQPTQFLPLSLNSPPPSGTPVVLLPHGVPAYFISTYTGPSTYLHSQFTEALAGFGVGDWSRRKRQGHRKDSVPIYVIVWVSVQNKQGEDKGIPIVWPQTLCLSFRAGALASHARSVLKHLPDLPPQLQASPPPPAPYIPISLLSATSSNRLLSTDSEQQGGVESPKILASSDLSTSNTIGRSHPSYPRFLSRSPVSDSLLAFRSLTVSNVERGLTNVASEVSSYVDYVAKERERERERIRRERDVSLTKSSPSKPFASVGKGPQALSSPHIQSEKTPAIDTMQSPLTGLSLPQVGSSSAPSTSTAVSSQSGPSNAPLTTQPSSPERHDNLPVDNFVASASPDIALPAQQPTVEQTSIAYDPFGNFDQGWTQAQNEFMGMNLDYGMDLDIDLGDLGTGAGEIDDGFGAFTDDDFNFFDAPNIVHNAPANLSGPTPSNEVASTMGTLGTTLPTTSALSIPLLGEPIHLSGPGPPSSATTRHASSVPWLPHLLSDDLTSQQSVQSELFPLSPMTSPLSRSAPTTPSIQLTFRGKVFTKNQLNGNNDFEAIPFAASHKLADGKYAMGKFAISSETESEDPHDSQLCSSPDGWKTRYSAATDPRITLVRKLTGVKRRHSIQGQRDASSSPSWTREYTDWNGGIPSPHDSDTLKSDSGDEDGAWIDEDEEETRPVTPPPSYLPLGPTLIQTHFHHSFLLPLSIPLRPPGSVDNVPVVNAPISVPTPVSPAAILGAASEKTKSLEAAAQILVREVVENPIWADAWRTHYAAATISELRSWRAGFWQSDVKYIQSLFSHVEKASSPVDLNTLIEQVESDSTQQTQQPLDNPQIVIGKNATVIQVQHTALRFWQKLGLSPRSGKKDLVSFVFVESDNLDEDLAGRWLNHVSMRYADRNLGTHSVGQSSNCTVNGVVPVHFDSFRKTLSSFVSSLSPQTQANIVFYIVTPPSIINLTSPTLRHVLSAIKRIKKSSPIPHILFHFVPKAFLSSADDDAFTRSSGLDTFVHSVYDRILRPVYRGSARSDFYRQHSAEGSCEYLQDPAFTLARPLQTKIKLVREARTKSLDVADRYSLLHVGYRFTRDSKWLLASCVDQWGEAHDMKAWLIPDDEVDKFVVGRVWTFALSMAMKANVEWRLIITKHGSLNCNEFDAWASHLETSVVSNEDMVPIQVSILSAEAEGEFTFIAPEHAFKPNVPTRQYKTSSNSLLTDVSSTTLVIFPSPRHMHHHVDPLAELSHIPDSEDYVALEEHGVLPLFSSTLIHIPVSTDHCSIMTLRVQYLHTSTSPNSSRTFTVNDTLKDVVHNFHELSVLSRIRWKLKANPSLPFHLSALEVMQLALDRGDIVGEV
ncbi:Mediator of RNA polymerase II transcription subunit 13 [Abortiporus biennis]